MTDIAKRKKLMNMSKTGYVTARIEPKLKASAGRVLMKLGVSTTDAITMFFRQVVLQGGLPFEVRVPNVETRKAIEELEDPVKRSKARRYVTTEELLASTSRKRKKQSRKRA